MSGVASMARRAVEGLVVPFPSLSAVSALVVLVQLARLSACPPGFPRSSFRLPPSVCFALARSRQGVNIDARSPPFLPFPSLPFPFLFPAPAFPRQPALEEGGRAKAEGARRKAENQGGKGKRGHPAPHQHSNTSPRAHCTSAEPPLHLPDIDPFTTQLNNTTNTNHTHTVCRSARL